MFPIGVQDDDQKLAGRTLPRSHSPICSRHSATQAGRLCYHGLGYVPHVPASLIFGSLLADRPGETSRSANMNESVSEQPISSSPSGTKYIRPAEALLKLALMGF